VRGRETLAAPRGAARLALAAALKPIAGAIKKLDRLIAAAIASHPPFAALAARLDTVPGLGLVTIAAIIAGSPNSVGSIAVRLQPWWG
jgi:hypothetical protein